MSKPTVEHRRLSDHATRKTNWKNWGPYLSERAWGTVREDYSGQGDAWNYFPHDHARSRAYRWNEDGLAGICDRNQSLCFALALWNGRDPILKERLFGVTGPQGNHGEDVKEFYYYLDSTPTHSYMKMLYKYPQTSYPYSDLLNQSRQRGYNNSEYELVDTGILDENRYFDVEIEYAKAAENDILNRISIKNHGPDPAAIWILPTLWFRNTWSWGYASGPMGNVTSKPHIQLHPSSIKSDESEESRAVVLFASHPLAGNYKLFADGEPAVLFTENESNHQRLWGSSNNSLFVKDAFHRYLIQDEKEAINPTQSGTKAAVLYHVEIAPGHSQTFRLRLCQAPDESDHEQDPFANFETIFSARIKEADAFYDAIQNPHLSQDEKRVQRQALAGMLWSKQLYYYDVEQWLNGDPGTPPPPATRHHGRNHEWAHMANFDVISMPDKWEYPWYATWDLAFHCIPFTLVDPDFAKRQLLIITREWYMHPNGQLPAYEWSFGDVNPPVHAWAAWRVYKIDAKMRGKPDRAFLESIFHKLLLNFTWWTNRKDEAGNNIFQGGFLGMDNISVFDRSATLPTGGHIDQADGTAWMAAYSLAMLKIALELATTDPVYQDMATKFFEHFLRIAHAMSGIGRDEISLWDEEDGFFYDVLHLPGDQSIRLKVRSMVGLLPLFVVETIEPDLLKKLPVFARRMKWFVENRPHLSGNMASVDLPGRGERRLLAVLTRERLARVLRRLLDENEFLSPYGIRSVSKFHEANPYTFFAGGQAHTVAYWPGESRSGLFGGNSNWRGPIWFPVNYLIIESLQKFHHYYGDDFKVELPTGSGNRLNLAEVAAELSHRLINLFLQNENGQRPFNGSIELFQHDPHFKDLILFHEYFHGDNGTGLGASHQTGWTGLAAKLIQQSGGSLEP